MSSTDGSIHKAEPCLEALRALAERPEASEDAIDDVIRTHLCIELDNNVRLAVMDYVSNQVHYEVIRSPKHHAFWERVLIIALDKHRVMSSES